MKIVVITLDRTPSRLEAFHNSSGERVAYETVSAVDGNMLEKLDFSANAYFDGMANFGRGAIGNALSHMRLWESVVETGEPIIVCEDDALLHRDFTSLSSGLLSSLQSEWDYVMWGWNFDSILIAEFPGRIPFAVTFNQTTIRVNSASYRQSALNPSMLRLRNTFGTFCYAISPKGAARLLDLAKPMRFETVVVHGREIPSGTLDVRLNKFYCSLACFVSFPPLAISMNDHESSTVMGPEN